MRRYLTLVLFFLAFSMRPAYATSTGLNLIPTADTLPAGIFSLGGQTLNIGSDTEGVSGSAVVTEVGVGNRSEYGIDPIINSSNVLINGKYRFLEESKYVPAFAVGVQNFNAGLQIQLFIVGYKTFSIARLHFGIISTGSEISGMFGIDKQLSELVIFQTDYTSGPGNAFSIGVNIGRATGWNFNPAWVLGNSNNSSGYFLDLEWAGRLW